MKRSISLIQASILLANLGYAIRNKNVGFEDADRTYSEMVEALAQGRGLSLKQDVLESALWACNMLDEREIKNKCLSCGHEHKVTTEFFHPLGHSFDSFVKRIMHTDEKFNKELNYIEKISV